MRTSSRHRVVHRCYFARIQQDLPRSYAEIGRLLERCRLRRPYMRIYKHCYDAYTKAETAKIEWLRTALDRDQPRRDIKPQSKGARPTLNGRTATTLYVLLKRFRAMNTSHILSDEAPPIYHLYSQYDTAGGRRTRKTKDYTRPLVGFKG